MLPPHRAGSCAALALILLAASARAQPPGLPSAPVPVTQPPSGSSIPPISIPGPGAPPPAYVPSTPIFIDPPPRTPAPLPSVCDPPRCAAAGFYAGLEIDLLFPELHGWLSGPVTVAGFPDTVTLTSAHFNWTGSPRIEIGYRLADNWGALAASYRAVVAQGHRTIDDFDPAGPGFETSRLNMNVVDLDYLSPAYDPAPFWAFSWRAGVRIAAIYFDHRVQGEIGELSASNNFIGAGPHFGLELGRTLDLIPGLALNAKIDGAVVIGGITQSFDETILIPGGPAVGGASRFSGSQAAPVFTFSVGLTYTPPNWPQWARFGFGYQFEYWWDIGTHGDSRGDLSTQGLYFRGEFNF
jgi:hypothetical protein